MNTNKMQVITKASVGCKSTKGAESFRAAESRERMEVRSGGDGKQCIACCVSVLKNSSIALMYCRACCIALTLGNSLHKYARYLSLDTTQKPSFG